MGIDEVSVDPGIGLGRQLVDHQLPGGQHDLAILVVEEIPIDVDIVKIVIQPYGLNLPVGLKQRALVPDPDVLDRYVMLLEILGAELVVHFKIDYFDFIQVVGLAGIIDIVGDVGGFFGQFIGFDYNFLDQDVGPPFPAPTRLLSRLPH